jgi:hypothetical protein
MEETMKRTAKKEPEKKSGTGAAVAFGLLGLGFVALGTALGYAVGSEKREIERDIRKLKRRTRQLREMVDDVEEKSKKLQVVSPEGTFPLFDQSEDIDA